MSRPSTVPEETYVPDPRRWKALGVCLVVGVMTLLDVSIGNAALPSISARLVLAVVGFAGTRVAALAEPDRGIAPAAAVPLLVAGVGGGLVTVALLVAVVDAARGRAAPA